MVLSKYMTIQAFSERTGISKSALRYYESRSLLRSVGRNPSGYRVYSEDQIAIMKVISSLRLADVPIKDIQAYIKESEENKRQKMMENWIESIKQRQEILNVSLRYLENNAARDQIYLVEKNAEKVIWFSAESKVGKFGEHVMNRMKELERFHIPIKSFYIKYLSGRGLIQAQIGFKVPFDIKTNGLSEEALVVDVAPCICIAMPFRDSITEIPAGYQKMISYASEHKWIPTGPILEWYRGEDFTDLDLLLPVMQLGKRGRMGNE